MSNAELYRKIVESRRENPKRFALAAIGVLCEELRNYAKSKGCDRVELEYLQARSRQRRIAIQSRYHITDRDIQEYASFNGYDLCKLEI